MPVKIELNACFCWKRRFSQKACQTYGARRGVPSSWFQVPSYKRGWTAFVPPPQAGWLSMKRIFDFRIAIFDRNAQNGGSLNHQGTPPQGGEFQVPGSGFEVRRPDDGSRGPAKTKWIKVNQAESRQFFVATPSQGRKPQDGRPEVGSRKPAAAEANFKWRGSRFECGKTKPCQGSTESCPTESEARGEAPVSGSNYRLLSPS